MTSQEIWSKFCSEHKVMTQAVELFDLDKNGYVETIKIGKDKEFIRRSSLMEDLVPREVAKLRNDFEALTNEFDGVIYMIGKKNNTIFCPLYIGKSEKFGKRKQNFSTNLNCGQSESSLLDGVTVMYIMGGLSARKFTELLKIQVRKKYQGWAGLIFTNTLSMKLTLETAVWFWMKAWKKENLSPWKEIGPVGVAGHQLYFDYLG